MSRMHPNVWHGVCEGLDLTWREVGSIYLEKITPTVSKH